jgi:hypothetical protein
LNKEQDLCICDVKISLQWKVILFIIYR